MGLTAHTRRSSPVVAESAPKFSVDARETMDEILSSSLRTSCATVAASGSVKLHTER